MKTNPPPTGGRRIAWRLPLLRGNSTSKISLPGDAIAYSLSMAEITTTTNPNVTIPLLDFRGIATRIDIRKIVQTGILP